MRVVIAYIFGFVHSIKASILKQEFKKVLEYTLSFDPFTEELMDLSNCL